MEKQTAENLKKLGLQGLENVSKITVDTLFKAIEVIVTDSKNKIDDAILPFLPLIKARLIDVLDNISK